MLDRSVRGADLSEHTLVVCDAVGRTASSFDTCCLEQRRRAVLPVGEKDCSASVGTIPLNLWVLFYCSGVCPGQGVLRTRHPVMCRGIVAGCVGAS